MLPQTPTLLLYDTLSRTLQPIVASNGQQVRIYTCGPTIYDRAHIGNFRTFLFEDIVRRMLSLLGFSILQVMNLTDVDDKTIQGALKAKKGLKEYTDTYAQAFFSDLKLLRITPAEHYPRATEYIPQMMQMITTLINRGHAYVTEEGSVYYKVASYKEYGKLSHLPLEELREGASGRTNSDEYLKTNLSDFVLWKAFEPDRDGDIFWTSPWGKGRPGWHIECSVMSEALLGTTIDLHMGGVDLIFPHHENEIAQSESAHGCCFSHHWAHAEHLLVDGKKMSKSLKNVYTLDTLQEKGFSAEAIRFFLISTHYRTQLNCTFEGLSSAEAAVRRIRDCMERLSHTKPNTHLHGDQFAKEIETTRRQFIAALAKDLNVNEALSYLFETIRKIHHALDHTTFSEAAHKASLNLFYAFDAVFDILSPDPSSTEIPQDICDLVTLRTSARETKNWAESDRLRNMIAARGYTVEDTQQGQKISRTIPDVAKVNHNR